MAVILDSAATDYNRGIERVLVLQRDAASRTTNADECERTLPDCPQASILLECYAAESGQRNHRRRRNDGYVGTRSARPAIVVRRCSVCSPPCRRDVLSSGRLSNRSRNGGRILVFRVALQRGVAVVEADDWPSSYGPIAYGLLARFAFGGVRCPYIMRPVLIYPY